MGDDKQRSRSGGTVGGALHWWQFLGGWPGSLFGMAVFRHVGTFSDGVARSKWGVVPDSGTEELRGLRGEGSYGEEKADAEHGGLTPLSFTFDFEGTPTS